MAEPINVKTSPTALINAVEAVTKANAEANDKWLNSLEKKANGDEEAKKKVTTLKFFNEILSSSITPPPNDDRGLGRLVSEIRGYQDLTERFFSDLRKLTVKDQLLEKEAVKKRNELFEVLNQVQEWLLKQKGGTSPSEFGACTTLFLKRMQPGSKELSLTQQLFKNQYPKLAESDLRRLTDAWGEVVSIFVEDSQDTDQEDSVNIGEPDTIANFLCIHNRLETLYGRLGTHVSLDN